MAENTDNLVDLVGKYLHPTFICLNIITDQYNEGIFLTMADNNCVYK